MCAAQVMHIATLATIVHYLLSYGSFITLLNNALCEMWKIETEERTEYKEDATFNVALFICTVS